MNNHTRDLRRNAWTNGGAYIVGSVLFLLVSVNLVGAVPKWLGVAAGRLEQSGALEVATTPVGTT
jgi:hypothetical protein